MINEFEHRQILDEEKPWITPELLILVRQKDEMQEWANKCPTLAAEYRKFRNHVRMKVRKAKIEYEDPTGEKRDAEYRERMLKKGLTLEEIEIKKNMPKPETHHGGKKYAPPVIYPGNLSLGSTTMKVGGPTETVSVTRDPTAYQQNAKFQNLLSQQSKTVYESFRKKDVTRSNWSEGQEYPVQDQDSSYQYFGASYAQPPNTFSNKTQGFFQNSANFTQPNMQNPKDWASGANQQKSIGSSGGSYEYAWSSNYNYSTSSQDEMKGVSSVEKNVHEEEEDNPWVQAMADYWKEAAQDSDFGKSKGIQFNARQTPASATLTAQSQNNDGNPAQPKVNVKESLPNKFPAQKALQTSNLPKQDSAAKIKVNKPPFQYFKGVAKNKNKIHIKISQSTLGTELPTKQQQADQSFQSSGEVAKDQSEESKKGDSTSESLEKEKSTKDAIEESSKLGELQTTSSNQPCDISDNKSTEQKESIDNSSDELNMSKLESQKAEVSAKNTPKETKSDADLADNSPIATDLKPVDQSLIEAQKNLLAKVSSSKPLKDKNWSESLETCDQDIEELELSVDNPNFFPHPSTVTPPRGFTVDDGEGNSFIAPNNQGNLFCIM